VVVVARVWAPAEAILVEASGQFFVRPDNGVFAFILVGAEAQSSAAITNAKYFCSRSARRSTDATSLRRLPPTWRNRVQPTRFGKLVAGLPAAALAQTGAHRKAAAGQVAS